jgi:hypothetical protein
MRCFSNPFVLRTLTWISRLAVLLFVLAVVVSGVWSRSVKDRVDFKRNLPHENRDVLANEIRELSPEIQFEDDTCGLHALRTVYRAYGLDPDAENLRARLGLDVPANPADAASTGTLQFDLLRVLAQDGFVYTLLDPVSPESPSRLLDHMEGRQAAIALIRRRENGNLHWVALSRGNGERVRVADSLFPRPYPEPAVDFLRECVVSCVLVEAAPSGANGAVPVQQAEHDGLREMMRTPARLRRLQDPR